MADNLGLGWRPEQDFPYQEGDKRRDVISARLWELGAQAPRWRHGFATGPALGEGGRSGRGAGGAGVRGGAGCKARGGGGAARPESTPHPGGLEAGCLETGALSAPSLEGSRGWLYPFSRAGD